MADTEEYKAKLKALKKYVPFLKNMMIDLQTKGNREAQLNKIQSLYDMITDDRKKLKLETLNRCEEVLTNIYIKVNPQIKNKTILAPASPTQLLEVPDSPERDVDETPRSPSPERTISFNLTSRPVTIPTEKVNEFKSQGSSYGISKPSNIPKIDIYGAAAFDILCDKKREPSSEVVKIPDISKPPITLDDLKNLENDVQDRITAVQLNTKPIDELERYKKDLELQLRVESINRTMSPKSSSQINTTVRNRLDLSHIKKSKEAKSSKKFKFKDKHSEKDDEKQKVHKVQSKIVKPPDPSDFDILLSEEKKRVALKDDRDESKKSEGSSSRKDKKKDNEKSKKDKRDSSKEKSKNSQKVESSVDKSKDKKREESNDRREHSKDRKKEHKSESKKKNDDKKRDGINNDSKSRLSTFDIFKTNEGSQSSLESASPKDNKYEIKKPQTISNKEARKSFEEQLIAPEQQKPFKRLADKYNPKPKKPPPPDDFDKLVSKSIEKSMKISPVKVPSIFDRLSESTKMDESQIKIPTQPVFEDEPPPEPEKPKTVQLPEILQKIFQKANKPPVEVPKTSDPRLEPKAVASNIRNLPADPRRRIEIKPPPLLSRDPLLNKDLVPPSFLPKDVGPPLLSPPSRHIPSLLSPSQQSGSLPYPVPSHSNLMPNPNQGLQFQASNLNFAANHGLEFVPPSPLVDFTSPSPRVDFRDVNSPEFETQPRFVPADFLENPVRPPFQNVNFLNREQRPNETMTQRMFGGQSSHIDYGNASYDRHHLVQNEYNHQSMNLVQNDVHQQSMNFYQVNNYAGMPLLQPELPQYLSESKPYMQDPTPHYPSWNDNMQNRWRDDRRPGELRSYREHREIREREERERREREKEKETNVRDPRVAKESQDKPEIANRDSRVSRDRERDSRREEDRHSRSKSRSRRERSKERPHNEEKSKFDKMYSQTNRDRSRSRSKSSSEEEVFTSPLDSLYVAKDDKRTGRGYGMQNFRIPKKRKDERPVSKSKERITRNEKEDKNKKNTPKKIISDEEDNIADNLSDKGGASEYDAVSDEEIVEKEVSIEKDPPKKPAENDPVRKKIKPKSSDDDVIVRKHEILEERRKRESKKHKQIEENAVAKKFTKEKLKKSEEQELVIKIEESESEEVIEIKDEEKQEKSKCLRKKRSTKPILQASSPSPTKRQPSRKVKKGSVPPPIMVKEENDDDVEEITTESEVIDVEDDEDTQREIEEIEASQIAESARLQPLERTQRATSEDMDLFTSEYVLEISGEVNKSFEPMEISTKQEITYETVSESPPPLVVITVPKAKGPKKSSSIEEEAARRIALINEIAKSHEIIKPSQPEQPKETEADLAAKELSQLLETSEDVVTVESQSEPISEICEQSNQSAVTNSEEPNKEPNQSDISEIQPEKEMSEIQPEKELPSAKASEVLIQEPTSSQDEQKSAEPTAIEKDVNSGTSEVSGSISGQLIDPNNSTDDIPKQPTVNEPESSKKSEEPAEPSEPNILAHFFENLLKSKNKKDKKTALFSLIQTFSDSFTDRELNKITKIITADQEEENSDNESTKSKEKEVEKEESNVVPPKETVEEETPIVGSTTEEEVVPVNKSKRIRRLSSTTEEENQDCDTSREHPPKEDNAEPIEPAALESHVEEPVLVSVGERIKRRRRNLVPPTKHKKKTELDRIHEDIKEMFIRDGVLTATGKRMTRMLKEDPNALSPTKSTNVSPEGTRTLRKKPGPKPKVKEDSKSLKDVRIVLSKMPDNKLKTQNRRVLRSDRKPSILENDGIAESNFADESEKSDFAASESSDLSESEDEEEDKKSQSMDTNQAKNKHKPVKRKSAWALGIIKKKKKSSTVKSKENSPERTASPEIDNNASLEEDLDKLFVEPDRNYYYDPTEKKKLPCKLCDFTGMYITTHYLREHPHSEVLCSRFSPDMAKDALKDYLSKKKRYDAIVNKRLALKYNYSCRFCGYTSQAAPIFFYEHLTTHTGEYRHQCGICHFHSVTSKTLNQHFLNSHPDEEKNAVRETYTKAIIYGYLCGECNYVQLKEKAVEEHVNIYHLGVKPKIYKISMSRILDPALEDTKTNLIVKPQANESIASVSTPADAESVPDKSTTEMVPSEEIPHPKKPSRRSLKKLEKAEETVTDSEAIEPDPPKIRRKPGPKSKTRPQEAPVLPSQGTSEAESSKEEQQNTIIAPVVRRKPGPKSKTRKLPIVPPDSSESEQLPEPETTDSEINKEQNESRASEEQNTGSKPAKISKKRRSLENLICKENGEDLDSVIALSSRSSRAAKEKASAHIKFFIETNEGSPRKIKALANEQKHRKSSGSESKNEDTETEKDESTSQSPAVNESDNSKPTDSNVFTCASDILQEEKKIEEERLKKMEELNKSLNARSSKLDFVEKLSNRLTNEDGNSTTAAPVTIKEEPKDTDAFERPETPMPVLEKEAPLNTAKPSLSLTVSSTSKPSEVTPENRPITAKKPAFEGTTPIPSVNVNLRSNSLFPDIIEKLQGMVGQSQSPTTVGSDSSEPVQQIEIGGLLRATKQSNAIVFSCHAANCYVSTKDKMVFQLHCKFGHRDIPVGESSLCDECGVNITTTPDTTLMENLYDHLMYAHSDFIDASSKPRMLRMRRLSGDKLSIKKEDELDSIKKEKEDGEPNKKPEEVPIPMDTTEPSDPTTPVASQGSLELAADNPFTFKIAEVMSLASDSSPVKQTSAATLMSPQKQNVPRISAPPAQVIRNSPTQISQPPPLTLLNLKPQTQSQLVIKEAKLTQAELNKPRKAPKAMTKFIETPGDLYKCPHYYCLFTTNFRAFLERHLKAHKSDTEVMIPCVYCDIKTPWEHVPMHIDIRHAHCRYACSYCLYRSWMQEYVCLHQNSQHPGLEYSVIQLPPHKAAKKFSVADLKTDPKTLCEPFRCICGDGTVKEYLYENEFDQHLKTHSNQLLPCGYKGCTVRKIAASLVINHWGAFHGICTYQCGYCKMSNKDIVKMFYHFSQFHQWMGPDILVRIGDYILDITKELGYSAEAFEKLAHITNLPSNVLFTMGKSKGPKKIKFIHLTQSTTQPSVTSTDTVACAVASSSNVTNLTSSLVKPAPVPSLVSQNVQLVVTTTTAQNNLYLLPAETTTVASVGGTQLNLADKLRAKIVSICNPPEMATLPTVSSSSSTTNATSLVQGFADTDVATLKSLMSSSVTIASTTCSVPSESGSPLVTDATECSKVDASAILPPGISWTKVGGTNNRKDFVDGAGGSEENRAEVENIQQEKGAEVGGNQVLTEPPSKPTESHVHTSSPILLLEPDENSLDEPLFDNIDVNTDSPVVDPLSIEPTIAGMPSEDPIGSAEDPMGLAEDPLSLPIQDSSEAEVEPPADKRSEVQRSESVHSNSDEEPLEKTGLQGYQLYRCAICSISFSNSGDFKQHINLSVKCRKDGTRPYKCVHCKKLVKSSSKLLQHIQTHGVLRYSCSLCSSKFAVSYLAKTHMKFRHQISQSKMIPVVPPPGTDKSDMAWFLVRPVLALQPPTITKENKESTSESPSKSGGEEMTFTPANVNDIPIRQIFTQPAKCGLCNYQTKVRVNIVRHLQMHSDDKWVPDTAPVNPVPCLDRNEKMFDKMINLAASSMDGRMGGAKTDKEEEKIPEYIPSYCRYICCAQGCTYLCLEEGNLRHHIMALHSDELEFCCGHCKRKIEPPDVDSVIKHLKLHGLHLYKCKYCMFVHHLKHKVERHISDTHIDSPVKVTVVRQMEAEQDNDRSVEPVKDTNVIKTKPWKCCFCKYTTTTEELIKNHIATRHNLDCQFKCALCSYKSNERDSFYEHFREKHSSSDLDIIYVYQYIEEPLPKEDDGHNDTTPLWQRDKARVRHIRGILLDEAAPEPTRSPKSKTPSKLSFSATKSGPSKNLFNSINAVARGEGDVAKSLKTYGKTSSDSNKIISKLEDKSVKLTSKKSIESDPLTNKSKMISPNVLTVVPKSSLIEDNNGPPPLISLNKGDRDIKEVLPSIEELTRVKQSSNDPIIIIDDDDDDEVVPISKPQSEVRGKKRAGTTDLLQEALKMAKLDELNRTDIDDNGTPISEYSEENLKKIFGDFGSPNNRQWKCPLCLQFRSKRISDFIFHIYKDLNIFRYRCKSCKDESITFKYMIGHIKTHFEPLTEEDIEVLPPKLNLEAWIQMVLREQSIIISNNIQNMSKPVALVDENIPCMFCSLRFPNAAEASEHMLKHWITKPFLCAYCPSDFYTRYELRHHQATAHPASKQVLHNVSPTVSEAMHRFDDGFRKRHLAPSRQDFSVAPKKMKFTHDSADSINIVSVNDILNKGKDGASTSGDSSAVVESPINVDSDDDLVMVTKKEDFVPNEDDVYACMMCAYVTDRELNVSRHLETNHGTKSVTKFKILSKKDAETSKDVMACNVCHVVLSELKLRLHFIENHQQLRCHYSPYAFTCNMCSSKFALLKSVKQHYTSKHPNVKPNFSTIEGYIMKGTLPVVEKAKSRYYRCAYCQFSGEAMTANPMRAHVKSVHLKCFECDVCNERFKSEQDTITHHRKSHDIDTQPKYHNVEDVHRQYLETMRLIIKMSTPVEEKKKVARKSTSSPQQTNTSADSREISDDHLTAAALRSIQEPGDSSSDKFDTCDVSRIRTTVVIDGIEKSMTFQELGDAFQLETYVDLSDSLVSAGIV